MRGLCVIALGFAGACNSVFDIEDTRPAPPQLTPRTLVFDNTASQVDLVDFPVLVSLDDKRIEYDKVANPSTDLRFESDGVDLSFEIEHWDPAGVSSVWVKVPKITAGSRSDHILMHYGPAAAGSESRADVWNRYDLVIHGDGDFRATVGAPSRTIEGDVTRVAGQVGGAMRFAGVGNTSVTYGGTNSLLDAWSEYTVEMWIYADYESAVLASSGIEPRFFEKRGAMTLGRLVQTANPYVFNTQIDTHYEAMTAFPRPYAPVRHWFQRVQTYDGYSQFVYGNGLISDYDVPAPASPTVAGTDPVVLGSDQSTESITGMLDEVRISRHAHSPYWIEAQYKAMTGAFVTFYLPGEGP